MNNIYYCLSNFIAKSICFYYKNIVGTSGEIRVYNNSNIITLQRKNGFLNIRSTKSVQYIFCVNGCVDLRYFLLNLKRFIICMFLCC